MYLDEKKGGETTLETWRLHLLKAADLLESNGWCQYTYRDYRGQRCLMGALHDASWSEQLDDGFGGRLPSVSHSLAVGHLMCRLGGSISHWNDHPGRTQEEVVAVLREAATT